MSRTDRNRICLTLDTDWAPDPVLEDALSIISDSGARATIFATNASSVLAGLDRSRFELAIHPNLNWLADGSGVNYRHRIDDLLSEFPETRGARSHSLTNGAQVLDHLVERGLVYDSNLFIPRPCDPFPDWNGLVRVPFSFSDLWQAIAGLPFEVESIQGGVSPAVVAFHPIHVFLNTESADRYATAKSSINDMARLVEFRNRGPRPGARDLLAHLCAVDRWEHWTAHEVAQRYVTPPQPS